MNYYNSYFTLLLEKKSDFRKVRDFLLLNWKCSKEDFLLLVFKIVFKLMKNVFMFRI